MARRASRLARLEPRSGSDRTSSWIWPISDADDPREHPPLSPGVLRVVGAGALRTVSGHLCHSGEPRAAERGNLAGLYARDDRCDEDRVARASRRAQTKLSLDARLGAGVDLGSCLAGSRPRADRNPALRRPLRLECPYP